MIIMTDDDEVMNGQVVQDWIPGDRICCGLGRYILRASRVIGNGYDRDWENGWRVGAVETER